MATIAPMLRVDGARLLEGLEDAREKLDTAAGEMALDFSSVVRLNPSAVTAMQALAGAADEKKVRVVLRGVSIDMYKVLKLVNLTQRFGFTT